MSDVEIAPSAEQLEREAIALADGMAAAMTIAFTAFNEQWGPFAERLMGSPISDSMKLAIIGNVSKRFETAMEVFSL